ncbi:cytidine and deoxycytidylate deaminase zinc-binding region family protein [Mycobacterium xenopi 4042]|uniref:Cytidine and deoxycytidylate deaminase zinc-binding region family protein n=1 Tax=Mycobacterium xenopi 4042 TaxID=1299334 RepID=X7ZGK7_MYCXE|nr:cytidine and deoxycytidylate deaminase zinc-binding region family protein [Mycobacterium xenopi 4042]
MVDSGELTVLVEIDGGINADTIEQAAEAGVDCFVAGSAVYGADDRPPPWKRCAARPGHVTASAPMSTPVAISYDAAMRLAVEHAELVKGNTYPNPPVGAVILDREGRVAGAGGTEPAGSAHAEIVALRRAGVWLRAGPRS